MATYDTLQVDIGNAPNDDQGDPLRQAFDKINQRFQELRIFVNNRGVWQPSTAYTADPNRDWVIVDGVGYLAISNHVSGATFAADLAAGKWVNADSVQLRADLASTVSGNGAELVGFKQAGTGAVDRTALSKMQAIVSANDFEGADKTGGSESSGAFLLALQKIKLAGGGVLTAEPGIYKVNQPILVDFSNVTFKLDGVIFDATGLEYNPAIRGSGAVFRVISPFDTVVTSLSEAALAGSKTIVLNNSSGVSQGDHIRLISDKKWYENMGEAAYYNDQNIVESLGVDGVVSLESPILEELTTVGATVSARARKPIRNIYFYGGQFIGGGVKQSPLGNSFGQCGIWAECVTNLQISNAVASGFQGVAFAADGVRDFGVDNAIIEGLPSGVIAVEGQNSSFYGVYAIRARRVRITRTTGIRVRHVCDGAEVIDFLQDNCNGYNTHRAAFGSHEEVSDLEISSCKAYDCRAFATLRAISANVHHGISRTKTNNNAAITGAVMLASDPGRAKFKITDCDFDTSGTTNALMSLAGCYSSLQIKRNEFSNGAGGLFIESEDFKNVSITDNSTSNCPVFFEIKYRPSGICSYRNLFISGNQCDGYTTSAVVVRGASSFSNPAENIKIFNNFGTPKIEASLAAVQLRAEGFYGEKIIIKDNDQLGDSSLAVSITPNQNYRLRAYPIVEKNSETSVVNYFSRTALTLSSLSIPDNITLFRGMEIDRSNPSAGQAPGWVVTSSGTSGSISGVVGSIEAGSKTLLLTGNDVTKVFPGCFINVSGAGASGTNLATRVVDVSQDFGTAVTDIAASTTATNTSVTRRNAVIKEKASLAA